MASVQFAARKEAPLLAATARIAVLASNVTGQYGLQDAWRLNGLSNSSAVQCGPPAPCIFGSACTTIWLQPIDLTCTDVAPMALLVNASESDFADNTTALIVLDMRARGLREGRYSFTLHLPVANSTAWMYQPVAGWLDVVGVADAAQSEASVCQGLACASVTAARFNSTNGGGLPLSVTILAKDVDGLELKRAGEAIAVVLRSRGVDAQTMEAVYSTASQQYTAEVTALTVAGEFSIAVKTPLGTAVKASFTVVCATGYEAAPAGECQLPRSVCETATISTASLAFTVNNTLQLSSLGSASAVALLPVLQTTRFGVRSGRATVSFESPGSFIVQIIAADGRTCTLAQSLRVGCPEGYEQVGAKCQPVLVDNVCAGLVVTDSAGAAIGSRTFTLGDRLQFSLSSSTRQRASAYRFQLVPTQGIVTGDISEGLVFGQTGAFSLAAEYTAAESAPVSCPLIPALNVTASQLCDQIQAEFSLASNTDTGAHSMLQAAVAAPVGAAVSVVATPLDSTVRVPLERGTMTGSAMLPSTGNWSVTLTIGNEQCTRLTQTVLVGCLDRFIYQRGQCLCPDGYANVQGQCELVQQRDPCQDATVRSSGSGALQRGTASVTLGTTLSVSLSSDAAAGSYKTLLIPKQGTEERSLLQDFAPSRTGTFSLDMEYGSAGGTPKRCTLLSAFAVQCPAGELEVDGECRAITQSACDLVSVDISLADDAERGARSLVKAALQLPDGASGVLIASPLQSAVEVNISQVGSLSGGRSTWEGSDSLPSTGAWELTLRIGREQCNSTNLQVDCTASAGFVDDGAGRCVCQAGLENKGGKCVPVQRQVDACQLASVRSSIDGTVLVRSEAGIPLRPGTQLSISSTAEATGYEALLIPLQGTEAFDTTKAIVLSRSGLFALKLKRVNSTQECSLIPRLEVSCGQDEQEVAGQCRRCPLGEGYWQDAKKECKKKPLMAVKAASDGLLVKLSKLRFAPISYSTIEVRLVRGDVDSTEPIVWTAISSAGWLRLGNTTGTVYSNAPVAAVGVVVNATGLEDTFTTGPLNATIELISSMPAASSSSSVFERGSSVLEMVAELTIVAEVDLVPSDLAVQTLDGGTLHTGTEAATGSPHIVTIDEEVPAGSKLIVTVKAFDYERLPISRPDVRIWMNVSMGGVLQGAANLLYLTANEYRAEMPAALDEGSYDLIVSSSTGSVTLRFTVSSSKQALYIALGISSVRMPASA